MTEEIKNILDLTEPIAKEFSAGIRKWLTAEEFDELVEKNSSKRKTCNTGACSCATHDYCDSSMLMFEILSDKLADQYEQKVIDQGGPSDDEAEYTAFFTAWNNEVNQEIQSPETTPLMTLWNNAWDMARANNFYGGLVK